LGGAGEAILMKWILFVCGLVLGALGAFAFVIYAHANKKEANDDILFHKKVFFDQVDGRVVISGTLTGKGLANPNNTYGINCMKDRAECLISYVDQIGPNQIGMIESPYSIPISKWNTYEVIAADDGPCSKTTITISRKTQSVLWVEEPIITHLTEPLCKYADTEIHKFTIEDSPGWKGMEQAVKQAAARGGNGK
jgi:hypothetical protein